MRPVQSKRAVLCDLKMPETRRNILKSSCKAPDFKQIWIFSADFLRSFQYQFSLQSSQWGKHAKRGGDGQNYSLISFQSKIGFLRRFNFTAKNKTYLSLHAKWGISVPNVNQIWISQQTFIKAPNFKPNINPMRCADIQGQSGRRTDRQTDMTKVIGAFRSYYERAWKIYI